MTPDSNQKAADALHDYFVKEHDRDGSELYYNPETKYVDGRLDLAAVVRVVRDALKASPPAPREPVK